VSVVIYLCRPVRWEWSFSVEHEYIPGQKFISLKQILRNVSIMRSIIYSIF
jgi:hypothetical protein